MQVVVVKPGQQSARVRVESHLARIPLEVLADLDDAAAAHTHVRDSRSGRASSTRSALWLV